jgi:hypothetical protein
MVEATFPQTKGVTQMQLAQGTPDSVSGLLSWHEASVKVTLHLKENAMYSVLANILQTLNPRLRERVIKLIQPLGVEFHRDLGELMSSFGETELERFTELWLNVVPEMRTAFVAFVVTGDDPDGAFLRYLDENRECQEAVDLAFAAHIDGLQNLGKSLAEADQAISQNKAREISLLISGVEKAEVALEDAEDELETLGDQPAFAPVLRNVQAALHALEGTTCGLRALAGTAEVE